MSKKKAITIILFYVEEKSHYYNPDEENSHYYNHVTNPCPVLIHVQYYVEEKSHYPNVTNPVFLPFRYFFYMEVPPTKDNDLLLIMIYNIVPISPLTKETLKKYKNDYCYRLVLKNINIGNTSAKKC